MGPRLTGCACNYQSKEIKVFKVFFLKDSFPELFCIAKDKDA